MAHTTWQDGLRRLFRRVDTTGESITNGFPHYGDPTTGRWTTAPGGDWTGGFWDFDVPAGPDTPRDTSGTAIAAAALIWDCDSASP